MSDIYTVDELAKIVNNSSSLYFDGRLVPFIYGSRLNGYGNGVVRYAQETITYVIKFLVETKVKFYIEEYNTDIYYFDGEKITEYDTEYNPPSVICDNYLDYLIPFEYTLEETIEKSERQLNTSYFLCIDSRLNLGDKSTDTKRKTSKQKADKLIEISNLLADNNLNHYIINVSVTLVFYNGKYYYTSFNFNEWSLFDDHSIDDIKKVNILLAI